MSTLVATLVATIVNGHHVYAYHFRRDNDLYMHDAIVDTDPCHLEWMAVHEARNGVPCLFPTDLVRQIKIDCLPVVDSDGVTVTQAA